MNQNPISNVGLYATPENMESLQKYIAMYSGSEAVAASTCAWMAWNLASKVINDILREEQQDDKEYDGDSS